MGADCAAASRGANGRPAALDLPATGGERVFYLLQTGCQWRMLPRDFPPRSTVYGYFRAWIAAGVWAHVHDVLYRRSRELEGRDESPTAAIIDSQSVRTGAEAREMVGYDAGKRVKGRKRHLVTDTLGLVLRIEVHSAGVQDRDGAVLVLDRITRRFPILERFFADAGYQGPRVAEAAPPRSRSSSAATPASSCSRSAGWSNAPSPGPASTVASPVTSSARSNSRRSISCRSERIEYNACSSSARISRSGGIDGRPTREYDAANRTDIPGSTSSAMPRITRSG
jgi:transposase